MQLESSNMPGAQKTDLGIGKVFGNSNKSIYWVISVYEAM